MQQKPFSLGIMVGRFQTFHIGHEYMIRKAEAICGRVGIFIGSSQESGTQKNLYSYAQREAILRRVFVDRIDIFPLPDIGVGNNAAWGKYVLQNVYERFGQTPDLLISGKEERRVSWLDSIEGISVAELYVPKVIDISATQMRSYLIDGDMESWRRYTNPALWADYEILRAAVLNAQEHTETASI